MQDMKALWIVAAVSGLAWVPRHSDGVEPPPAAVAAVGQRVTVYGAVVRQGRYALTEGMTLNDALKMAGRTKEIAKLNKAKVIRKMDTGKNETIYVDLEKDAFPLKPGDVIIVDEKLENF
jgi:protein involved in polysaccharide export with SLBB domain